MHCAMIDKLYQRQQMHSSMYYVFYYSFAPTYFGTIDIFREPTSMLLQRTRTAIKEFFFKSHLSDVQVVFEILKFQNFV
jgi:hypothetical protein